MEVDKVEPITWDNYYYRRSGHTRLQELIEHYGYLTVLEVSKISPQTFRAMSEGKLYISIKMVEKITALLIGRW